MRVATAEAEALHLFFDTIADDDYLLDESD